MKSNRINIIRTGKLLLLLFAWMLLQPAEVRAQAGSVNDGMVQIGLLKPNNFIYYGQYKHAKEKVRGEGVNYIPGAVTDHELSPTPILWRIMGEEAPTDEAITLLSEYVLDSLHFGSTGSTQTWETPSYVKTWLNSASFTTGFTPVELSRVKNSTVSTPSSLSGTADFYLPWGDGTDAYWGAGTSNVFVIPTAIKWASLKNQTFVEVNNVYYWLRTLSTTTDHAEVVMSDGRNDIKGLGERMGVRPIFKLDTSQIIYASELITSSDKSRVDQIEVVDANVYRGDALIPNGRSGANKAFKLTVVNTSSGAPTLTGPLDYDLDEKVSDPTSTLTDTVYIHRGAALPFTCYGGHTNGTLTYKIVNATPSREVVRYGRASTPGIHTISLEAKNIFVDTDDEAGDLTQNSNYTAYVWSQYDHLTDNCSNEASEPLYFTLRVLNDVTAPVLALLPAPQVSAKRNADYSAEVTFNITEDNREVKYYYVVDPGTTPTSFSDFVTLSPSLPNKTKIKLSATTEQITISIPTNSNNNIRHFYIVAKDLVRNISNVLEITIPIYVPNSPMVAISPVPDLIMEEGDSITIAPGFVATDPDTDDHLTFVPSSVVNSDPLIAEATIVSGSITVNDSVKVKGLIPGTTDFTVSVTDNSTRPPSASTITISNIPVMVTERMPDAVIDYIEEQLTGLTDGWYGFNGEPAVEITDGVYPIADDWFDTDLDIVRVHPGNAVLNSPTQTLTIPARPDAPVLSVVDESYSGWNDGQINSVSSEMEYKADTMAIWTPVAAGYNTVFGLTPGKYQVRYKAAIDRFVSWVSVVTIRMGAPWTAFQRMVSLPDVSGVTSTPSPGIHYTASSTSFAFSLKFGGAPRSVTTSRVVEGVPEVLTGVANAAGGYDYVILRLQQPVAVYIGDAIQANASIEAERTIWSHAGRIYVEASKDDTATIYALTGQLLKQVDVQEGTTGITIGRGVYVVVLKNGAKQKVIVH